MTKNKIFFAILGWLIFIGITFLTLNLRTSQTRQIGTAGGAVKVWILYDDVSKFNEYINTFKKARPQYANVSFEVESFSDELSYYNSLVSSIISGKGPDIFVMNNSEISPLENQILWIPPTLISPNDFRLHFKTVFWEDLIINDSNDNTVEFLKWVPLWYETLGIFYNRKYFLRPSEMKTWTDFSKEVKNIQEKYSRIIPVALWNGTKVSRSPDVLKNLFVLDWVESLIESNSNTTRQALAMYKSFGQKNGDNKYSILSTPLSTDTDIDFFTQGDVAAMFWYPRDLIEINKIGYQKSFLFATAFPWYAGKEKKLAVNYNYFSVNKDSKFKTVSLALLEYMSSVEGQQAYIDTFPYYLSPESSVELAMSEKKILPQYNIVYKNFIDEGTLLASYDSWDKISFDREIKTLLDMPSWYDDAFSRMRSFIVCSSTKQRTLLNLSSSCK